MNERLDALVKEVTAEPDLEVSSSTVLTSITGFIRENANSPRALVDFARDLEAYRAPLALAIAGPPKAQAAVHATDLSSVTGGSRNAGPFDVGHIETIKEELGRLGPARAPLDRIVATSPEMAAGRAAALADQGKPLV